MRALELILALSVGAGCTNAVEVGNVSSAIEAGAPPTPTYQRSITDHVTGDNTPVMVTGGGAPCPANARCFVAEPGADSYDGDLYERPAPQGSLARLYSPAIDIVSGEAGITSTWLFYKINLYGPNTGQILGAPLSLPHHYGIEINFDDDQRGDLIIDVTSPSSNLGVNWGSTGIVVKADQNETIGGPNPLEPDGPGQSGGGYEKREFENGQNFAQAQPGGTTAVQARINGASVEIAIYRPFLTSLTTDTIAAMAFRPYADSGSVSSSDLYTHDDKNRAQIGSPYPWLSRSGAPATCPSGSSGDAALTANQIAALESGTNVNTGIGNPCYAVGGIYMRDNAGTIHQLAAKADLQVAVDLSITKTDNADPVNPGDAIIYTLTVTNNSTGIVTGAEITDPLSPAVEFVNATNPGCSYNAMARTVTCQLPALMPGAVVSRTITVRTTNSGTVTNSATVTSNGDEQTPANNTATITTVVMELCGNGAVNPPEVCDDGNSANNDGCNNDCRRSNGQSCTNDNQCSSGICDPESDTCEPANTCGNGEIEPANNEACDDGNTANGDGCESDCKLGLGEDCTGDNQCSSGECDENGSGTCEPAGSCGNGTVNTGEACDDGNNINDDGCDADCRLSNGEDCTDDDQCSSGECDEQGSDTCEPANSCGNGTVNPGESCDDGNTTNGDGCESDCKKTNGEPCTNDNQCSSGECDEQGSGTCEPDDVCGNGDLEGTEGCDDGNTVTGDGCSATCLVEDGGPCDDHGDCQSGSCDPQTDTCGGTDTDGDGVYDFSDIDDDNDGILDVRETLDVDGDDVLDMFDLDSDNDGIADASEAGHGFQDGSTSDPNDLDFLIDCPSDAFGTNGFCDALETAPDSGIPTNNGQLDTDGDSLVDARDLDSDNDGIPDMIESGSGCADPNKDALCDGNDLDKDGIMSSLESGLTTRTHGTLGARTPLDTDGDGAPDYRDRDSDGDNVFDILETSHAGLDLDANGVIDSASDEDLDGMRDPVDDSDLDGTPDSTDTDPSRFGGYVDGIVDSDDGGGPDFQDDDSDGDSVWDGTDNCRVSINPGQEDSDNDTLGNVCDDEDDRDWSVQGGCAGCATGGSPSGTALFALAVLGMVIGRRRRRAVTVAAAAAATTIAVVPANEAHAQAAMDVPGDFGTERFQLATDKDGILDVESGAVRPHLQIDMGLWFGYQNDPLVLARTDLATGREEVGALVANQVSGELLATIGLFERAQLGVVVPLVLVQEGNVDSGLMAPSSAANNFALGDLRLVPKLSLMRQGRYGVDLALLATVTLPTSSGDGYAGDTSVTFAPALALSRSFDTGMRLALIGGYRTREQNAALDLEVDDELFAGAGLGYDLGRNGGPPVGVNASFAMATAADDPFGAFNRNYAEVKTGLDVDVPGPLLAFAAAGVGVAEGYGTPDWRALAGVRVDRSKTAEEPLPKVLDTDRDGLVDNVDRCPTDPEDMDQFEDTDGCPDTDDDKDGIADASDQCRLEPEDLDSFNDSDGCPENDNDGDKIVDASDKCPNDAEDVDAFQDDDGCPDTDNDADTVLDAQDQCRETAGPVENQGCPWPDKDGDGVIDRFDNCPTWKGKPENNGCALPQLVKITESKLELYDTTYFATGKAQIQRRSFRMLDQVAMVLKSHPELTIKIEGHTDSVGSNARNLKLSQQRADAVMKYLVKKGVEQSRLSAQGFGEEQPIADNKSAKGRSQNRRVEFMATRTVETTKEAPATPGQTAPAQPAPGAPAPLEKP